MEEQPGDPGKISSPMPIPFPGPNTAATAARHEPDPDESGEGTGAWRRRLRPWLAAALAVLLLVLVPPLINANHYQRQIARSMSLSLGRPVHLDNVSLHLLPMPGLTLSNLVVSEDPAFGSEPTIRANTVEASLRLGSLWRRRVEFSTIRFEEPSVNLVRNEAGRWNLADVLLHAAHVNTAPTAQRRSGPAPRFPYIEATGGRVNVKLGDEKLPYSLTEADFALWQPSPHQWRVRLRGQPDRTDGNTTDPGVVRIEGDLLQATVAEDVHVDLRSSWHNAPLGEASLLLLGRDMGWRGSMNLEATLAGTLNQAAIKTQLTLGSLRRAEFAPAHPLDLQISCAAAVSIEVVTLRQATCTLPDNAATPATLEVAELNLQHARQAAGTLTALAIPSRWALLWAALYSPRVPTDSRAAGTFDIHLTHGRPDLLAADPAAPSGSRRHGLQGSGTKIKAREARVVSSSPSPEASWAGFVRYNLPAPETAGDPRGADLKKVDASGAAESLLFQVVSPLQVVAPGNPDADGANTSPGGRVLLRLLPTNLHPDTDSSLMLEGNLSTGGYAFSVTGSADRAALLAPAHSLPELGDDLEAVLPAGPDHKAGADQASLASQASQADQTSQMPSGRVDFSCSASWGRPQVCDVSRTAVAKARPARGATGHSSRRR